MRLTFGAFSLELCEGNAQVTSLSFTGRSFCPAGRAILFFRL